METLVKILGELSLEFKCDSDTETSIENKIKSLSKSTDTATKPTVAEIIAFLLEKGANVNEKNFENNTPLHVAVRRRDLICTHILVESGADINSSNSCWLGYSDKLFAYDNDTPLHLAVENDDLLITMYLVYRGADINACSRLSGTPLHIAIRRKNMSILKWLVTNEADVNAVNMSNISPVIFAYNDAIKDMEIVEYLIDNGADVNSADESGWTLLHRALQHGDTEFVKSLIDKGADINAKAGRNNVLHIALQWRE